MACVWRVALGNILLLLKHERNNCPSAAGCYVWSDSWGNSSHFAVMGTITQENQANTPKMIERWQEPGSWEHNSAAGLSFLGATH